MRLESNSRFSLLSESEILPGKLRKDPPVFIRLQIVPSGRRVSLRTQTSAPAARCELEARSMPGENSKGRSQGAQNRSMHTAELRVAQYVKGFCAEFEMSRLVHGALVEQCLVEIREGRAAKSIPAFVPKCKTCRYRLRLSSCSSGLGSFIEQIAKGVGTRHTVPVR
jgi:hypothetical protein